MGKSASEYATSLTSTAADSHTASLFSKLSSRLSSTKTNSPEKPETIDNSRTPPSGKKHLGLRKLLSNLFETGQEDTIAVQGQQCNGCGNTEAGKRYDNNAHCGKCYPTNFGCFSGKCTVSMFDGSLRRIDELKRRDRIMCGDGEWNFAEIVCILTIPVPCRSLSMVRFPGGLEITPTHPILFEGDPALEKGEWVLPREVQTPDTVACSRVFNLLVDQQHTAVVNGVICSLMGHKRDGDTNHDFWGNWDAVQKCLKGADFKGFQTGIVEVKRNLRSRSGRVWGFECLDGRKVFEVN